MSTAGTIVGTVSSDGQPVVGAEVWATASIPYADYGGTVSDLDPVGAVTDNAGAFALMVPATEGVTPVEVDPSGWTWRVAVTEPGRHRPIFTGTVRVPAGTTVDVVSGVQSPPSLGEASRPRVHVSPATDPPAHAKVDDLWFPY